MAAETDPAVMNLQPESQSRHHAAFRARLLAWYDVHARVLPWRAPPGAPPPDPYRIWLSEIMLQQTTVEAVKPYFQSFVARWPTVRHLAAESIDAVLGAWAGLGYYRRARLLHACAQRVVDDHDGAFPRDVAALGALPGVGPYTAAAIAAIAFNIPVTPVDGNIERVAARRFRIDAPLPKSKRAIASAASQWAHGRRPGDFAQALMDLGARICTPRRPRCSECPVRTGCAAHQAGDAERLPVKSPKKARPVRRAAAFVASTADGRVLMRRRPDTGILAGLWEASSPWEEDLPADPMRHAPMPAAWRHVGSVVHIFTHLRLELEVYAARGVAPTDIGDWLVPGEAGVPTMTKKVLMAAGL